MRAVEYWRGKEKDYLKEEKGTFLKVDLSAKIALCYPNTYYVGMSSLGFQTAYRHFNAHPYVKAERVFWEEGNCVPVSLESGRRLRDFTAVSFSVSFELDYGNVIALLNTSNIEPIREKRQDNDPILFCGGFVTYFNYRPLMPLFDFIFVGESDGLFNVVADKLHKYYTDRFYSKYDFLSELASMDGIYVPGFNKELKPPRCENNVELAETYSVITTPNTEFKNMVLLEIARGCPYSCKFCLAGNARRYRYRRFSSLKKTMDLISMNADKIGLVASDPSSHPEILRICDYLTKKGIKFSFSSLRASSVSNDFIEYIRKAGLKTLTLAPESASEKLRYEIGKKIKDEIFFDVIEKVRKIGITKVKFYFMIGLPGETEDDVLKIAEFAKMAAEIIEVFLSVNIFIPKPSTPFAECHLLDKKRAVRYYGIIRKKLSRLKNVSYTLENIRYSALQYRFAHGNEDLLLPYIRN